VVRDDELVFPTEDLDQLLDLARFVERHSEPGLLVGLDVEQVPLPGRSRPLQAPRNPR